jgi:hypothetical protein
VSFARHLQRCGALVVCLAALAGVCAGSALAAYTPRLVITHTPLALAASGQTDLTVAFGQNDDATARMTIYVPQGYLDTLGSPGVKVGTVETSVLAKLRLPRSADSDQGHGSKR